MLKILLVEDSAGGRRVIRHQLLRINWLFSAKRVQTCAGAENALDMLEWDVVQRLQVAKLT
jgi:CheY-like chemotaxis protein